MRTLGLLCVLYVLFFSFACGKSDAQRIIDWPEADMGDEGDGMWAPRDVAGRGVVGSGAFKNKVWINFEGGTVLGSNSFIVKRFADPQVVIPAFAPSDLGASFAAADRETLIGEILAGVAAEFTGLDITFARTQPSPPFHALYVGGNNFTGMAGLAGIAPIDMGNFSAKDILFAFPQAVASYGAGARDVLIHVICHEMAHALGARHITNNKALLNPVVYTTPQIFNVTGPLTGSTETENSYNVLKAVLGLTSRRSRLTLPDIKTLTIHTFGDIATLSVLHPDNLSEETTNLNAFSYTWKFKDKTGDGPTAQIEFTDPPKTVPQEVLVTAKHPETGEEKTFSFMVGKAN